MERLFENGKNSLESQLEGHFSYGFGSEPVGVEYSNADGDPRTHDSFGDCGQQCCFHAVFNGKIHGGRNSICAASVIMGKTIGMGDMRLVKQRFRILQKLFLLVGVFSAAVLSMIRIPVPDLYRLTVSTKEMANTFLLVLCVVVVGMSYQMPVNNGLIRGGGSASFAVKADLITIWMIVIPVSLLSAFVWKTSPAVVVCCLNADQIFKCIPAFIKVNYGNWARKLTRDENGSIRAGEKQN